MRERATTATADSSVIATAQPRVQPLVNLIRVGDRVTIIDRFGTRHTGRAVMQGPAGWVLNMGGRYGTPAIATDDNTTSVRKGGK